jgi:NADPH:quinone reductase-like Zn-dependent oxidoreductase
MASVRALVLTQRPVPGTLPDALRMVEIERPAPRPREALIQVQSSSINIDDIHMAEGTFYGGLPIGPRPRPDRPVIPGSDVAGIVVAAGRDVRSVRAGDVVFGVQIPFRRKGAWAEFCAVDERWVTKKPRSLSFATAAACGVSGLVALSAINALKIRPGVRIVIVGVTGGIGAMAAQLATRAGADVIGVCGTRNVDRAYQLGCSLVLDYRHGPWDQALLSRGAVPVDRVLDMIGGSDTERMGRRVLKRNGIFVTVVGPERFIGDRPLGWLRIAGIFARIGYRIFRSYIGGPRYILAGPGPGGGCALADVASAAAEGVLPPIDSKVPFELEPMREALHRAVAHRNKGRIVIQMDRELGLS